MTRTLVLVLLAIGSLMLSGCSTRAKLTITTEPEGGYVAKLGGGIIGIAPATVYYDASALQVNKDSSGCFRVSGFEAQWQSGAVTRDNNVRLCGSPTGTYQIQLIRDRNYPGLSQDMAVAVELRKKDAESKAATNAAMAAWLKANQASQQQRAPTSTADTPAAPSTPGTYARFKGSYVSGINRICLYERLGSEIAVTVGSMQACPNTPP